MHSYNKMDIIEMYTNALLEQIYTPNTWKLYTATCTLKGNLLL